MKILLLARFSDIPFKCMLSINRKVWGKKGKSKLRRGEKRK